MIHLSFGIVRTDSGCMSKRIPEGRIQRVNTQMYERTSVHVQVDTSRTGIHCLNLEIEMERDELCMICATWRETLLFIASRSVAGDRRNKSRGMIGILDNSVRVKGVSVNSFRAEGVTTRSTTEVLVAHFRYLCF